MSSYQGSYLSSCTKFNHYVTLNMFQLMPIVHVNPYNNKYSNEPFSFYFSILCLIGFYLITSTTLNLVGLMKTAMKDPVSSLSSPLDLMSSLSLSTAHLKLSSLSSSGIKIHTLLSANIKCRRKDIKLEE